MAAYAAVVSLMNNLEQIGNHPRLSSCFDDNQIQSLRENLAFLLDFVEGVGIASEEVKGLERRVASAAHAAEDLIESRVVDLLHAGFQENVPICSMDLQMILQGMSLIVAEVVKERLYRVQQAILPSQAGRLSSERKLMVGFDDVLLQLLDRLTGGTFDRYIIPIDGMSGTGKTTLAKHCYEHPLTKEHFDVRAWASVSLDYNVRGLLLELLSCFIGSTNKVVESTVDELGDGLYKYLTGRRYLIILDDMWSVECWDQIKYYLPDNNNGSRIIITTRGRQLASQFSYSLGMNLLDEYSSWNLFCQSVFGDEGVPLELEAIGRQIVGYCKGLPLAITVVGASLRESSMTREHWEHVAQDMGSGLNQDTDNVVPDMLMVSYNALPAYLKPCFLYLAIFPADQELSISRIIKLWVGEGFLKPHVVQTLEDIAEGYMKELIDRSLIVVSTTGLNGKPKNCRLHDLVRASCIRLADKEKFLSFVRTASAPAGTNSEHHYVALDNIADKHNDPQFFHAMESTLVARTLICESPALLSFKSRLLRVVTEVYSDSLETTFQLVNLRFLAFESPIGWIQTYELPSSISLLWNVQTLIMDRNIEEVVAPSEIWGMPQLRHLCFNRIRLPEPPASDDDHHSLVLPNLQTLRTALDFNCSEEVCKRMPNIRKLGIFYDDFSGEGQNNSWYCIDHVCYFAKLESLTCCFHRVPDRDDLVQNLKFPCSLRKLILQDCELHWDDMSVIGSLPLLQVLKLKCQSVRGAKWETVEGEFPSLRILEIDCCYLIYWFSGEYHFPRLEKLVLRRLYRLNEIPSEIGDLPTLGNISVFECSISAAISAARMLKEDCVIRVGFRKEKEVAEFRAKLELEGLASYRLQIDEL